MKRNFDALYNSRNTDQQYTEQDMQHLKLIEPSAVLPRGYTKIPRIPRSPRIVSRPALDSFENEYQAFIAKLKAKKAEKVEEEKIQEQLDAANRVETVQEPITEPVEETQNEIITETPIVEIEETQETVKPVKKTRKSKKTVVEPTDTVTETIETAETAE